MKESKVSKVFNKAFKTTKRCSKGTLGTLIFASVVANISNTSVSSFDARKFRNFIFEFWKKIESFGFLTDFFAFFGLDILLHVLQVLHESEVVSEGSHRKKMPDQQTSKPMENVHGKFRIGVCISSQTCVLCQCQTNVCDTHVKHVVKQRCRQAM